MWRSFLPTEFPLDCCVQRFGDSSMSPTDMGMTGSNCEDGPAGIILGQQRFNGLLLSSFRRYPSPAASHTELRYVPPRPGNSQGLVETRRYQNGNENTDSGWCSDRRTHCDDDAHIGGELCFNTLIARRTRGNRGTEPRYHAFERRRRGTCQSAGSAISGTDATVPSAAGAISGPAD